VRQPVTVSVAGAFPVTATAPALAAGRAQALRCHAQLMLALA